MCCVTPTQDVWQLEKTAGAVDLWWSPIAGIRVLAGPVTSTDAATKIARQLTGTAETRFHHHVWLDAPRSIWRGTPIPRQQDVREHVRQHTHARGQNDIDARAERWKEMNSRIAAALETVTWTEILKVPGAPASHCLLMHRIKSARLTGWSPAQEAVGCPHCPTARGEGGRLVHILWDCPKAQRLWTALRSRWDHLSSRPARWDNRTFLQNVFSLRLATMPDLLWDHAELARLPTPSVDDTSATHQALQAVWRRQVMTTFHVIWRWRMDASKLDELWTPEQATAYHDGCLRAVLVDPKWPRTHNSAASRHTAAALDVLRQADPERPPAPASTAAADERQYVLFFDGGSRGNPGPGGSGAVIIATSHRATQASLLWSAAMSAASLTTTNNQAEYDGVVAGLRAAREHGWTPLEVVGDSQFILGQLRDYRPPINPILRAKYAEARRLGDALGVRHWSHHLRAFNKMADAAANLAMDSRTSSQVAHPTTRADHAMLRRHLDTDFAHWQAEYFTRID